MAIIALYSIQPDPDAVGKNHAFLDGNKRTAIACAEIFLMLNDWKLEADNKKLETWMFGIAEGTLSKKELTGLLREHCCHK